MDTYTEILKIWNYEVPDEFEIYSELYYQMFSAAHEPDEE